MDGHDLPRGHSAAGRVPDEHRGRRPVGTRIVDEVDHGRRVVDGVPVRVTEIVWNGGGRSFDVCTDDGRQVLLTEDESLDALPDDEEIAVLLAADGVRPEP